MCAVMSLFMLCLPNCAQLVVVFVALQTYWQQGKCRVPFGGQTMQRQRNTL